MSQAQAEKSRIPFDADRLDALLETAGIDILLVNSKHNIDYLLGGYRFFFFEHNDAIGQSRYLPYLVYPRGKPEQAAYFGYPSEAFETANRSFWVPEMRTGARGTREATAAAIGHIRKLGCSNCRIGIEASFLPADAAEMLRDAFAGATLLDAVVPLERLRACKSGEELILMREATERVEAAMVSVIGSHGPGTTKRALVEALRREETTRDLVFEYCLITAGKSLNRAPSEQRWEAGDILSLDSGGTYHGYIGDICRMGILGEPDGELRDLLDEVAAIQLAAMRPIRAGVMGGDVYAGAEQALARAGRREHIHFVAHGVGLISHEVPHLTSKGPVPYSDEDASRPLEAGMVLSIETTMHHPTRGFVKLEDTVAVGQSGYELFGSNARGWNRGNI